jgi:hypothetical protein
MAYRNTSLHTVGRLQNEVNGSVVGSDFSDIQLTFRYYDQ